MTDEVEEGLFEVESVVREVSPALLVAAAAAMGDDDDVDVEDLLPVVSESGVLMVLVIGALSRGTKDVVASWIG